VNIATAIGRRVHGSIGADGPRAGKSLLISAAAKASPHSLPLTSIPPPAPPEQNASDSAAVFAVFAGTLGDAATRSLLLAGTSVAVGAGFRLDVFAK
jgi:hypothetical protein